MQASEVVSWNAIHYWIWFTRGSPKISISNLLTSTSQQLPFLIATKNVGDKEEYKEKEMINDS